MSKKIKAAVKFLWFVLLQFALLFLVFALSVLKGASDGVHDYVRWIRDVYIPRLKAAWGKVEGWGNRHD